MGFFLRAGTGDLEALKTCAGQWGRGSFHQPAFVHPAEENNPLFLPFLSHGGEDLFLADPHNEGTVLAGFGEKHKDAWIDPCSQ